MKLKASMYMEIFIQYERGREAFCFTQRRRTFKSSLERTHFFFRRLKRNPPVEISRYTVRNDDAPTSPASTWSWQAEKFRVCVLTLVTQRRSRLLWRSVRRRCLPVLILGEKGLFALLEDS